MAKAMWEIAEHAVRVGYIPEADLLFFMKTHEIQRLLSGERNPLLVMKAKQRKRLYPQMNAFKFDEFIRGFRMAPRVSFDFKNTVIPQYCANFTVTSLHDLRNGTIVRNTQSRL